MAKPRQGYPAMSNTLKGVVILKKSRGKEAHSGSAKKQSGTGAKVSEVFRKMGGREPASYLWKKKYGSLVPGSFFPDWRQLWNPTV
jgi:hypothetical protein